MTKDYIARLLDAVAVQDEHSHVDTALRERLGELILPAAEHETLEATAVRLVDALRRDELPRSLRTGSTLRPRSSTTPARFGRLERGRSRAAAPPQSFRYGVRRWQP